MSRFVLGGRSKARWLTTLPATPLAPTQSELDAGTDLVGTSQAEELMDIQGFAVQPSSIPTPGYAGTLVGNVAGDQTYPDSTLSFYKDDTASVIYTALARGNTGWVALMYDGQASGEEVDLFPATVVSRVRRPALNSPHIFDVNFAIDVPYEGTQAA